MLALFNGNLEARYGTISSLYVPTTDGNEAIYEVVFARWDSMQRIGSCTSFKWFSSAERLSCSLDRTKISRLLPV